MKTILHHYYLDMTNATERATYDILCAKLKVTHAEKFFNALAADARTNGRRNDSETVELDERWLYGNQWNEAGDKGRRLFDWYEGIYYNNGLKNTRLKEGHWLEQTPEMTAIRESTLTCGYCGKFVPIIEPHKWHCEKCLGSEYLKEKDLGLLRLVPIARKYSSISLNMTDNERAEITPLWKTAQGLGVITREEALKSKHRQHIAALVPLAAAKAAILLNAARIETDALTWLMDREINVIDNVIYYTHTNRFGFGWRKALTAEEKSKLLDVLSEFPFDYDFSKDPLR